MMNYFMKTRAFNKKWLFLCVAMSVLVCTVGCGPKRELATVTGKVTYRGKPLPFGTVMLQAAGGQPASGTINSDGTFEVSTRGEGGGAPVGLLQVRVICFECQGPHPPKDGSQGKPLIPRKYTSYVTSGLTFEVKQGQNQELILELTD